MSVYFDSDDLKSSLSVNDDFADDDFDSIAEAACRGIDRAQGRRYALDSADVTRRVTAIDPWFLNIRDLAELTTLKTDEDGDGTFEITWATTDFVLQPINASSDAEPFTSIEVHPNGRYTFPTRFPGAVQIVGRWGWPSIPPQIREAAALLTSKLIKRRREAPLGFVVTVDAAAYIARTDSEVAFYLNGLGRHEVKET